MRKLFSFLRHKIARALLSEEVARVDMERRAFLEAKEGLAVSRRALADEQKRFEAYKQSLTITDLVREQMKGFNPKLLDSADDLPEVLGDVEDQDTFLARCKSLAEADTLRTIAAYIMRNQIIYSAREAETLDTINFGRATINGVSLMLDEVDRLATIYSERHPPKEPEYDVNEVV